jgi:hypothetical protein
MRALSTLGLLLLVLTSTGCLRLTLVNASVRKPSNVAMYFSVVNATNKHPVAGITADQFKIYEDGKVVSLYESKQTILNPEVAVVQYTLLLMDLSGSVTQSGRLNELTEAAQMFGERVGKTQQVAVYGFDGQKDVHVIAPFQPGGAGLRSAISGLASFNSRDPSTNLNGAVIEGLKILRQHMDKAQQPIRVGSLVVFTDGTDHAHRVARDKVMEALNQAGDTVNVYVIGVGAEIDKGELNAIGRTATVMYKDPTAIRKAFDELAQIVEDYAKSFYLLSYCSPARAGEHELEIEANPPHRGSGRASMRFNANGFGPNCDPNTPPNFDLKHPVLPNTVTNK